MLKERCYVFRQRKGWLNLGNKGRNLRSMTVADRRRIIHEASRGINGASSTLKALQLSIRTSCVRHLLRETACLRYIRIAKKPAMREIMKAVGEVGHWTHALGSRKVDLRSLFLRKEVQSWRTRRVGVYIAWLTKAERVVFEMYNGGASVIV